MFANCSQVGKQSRLYTINYDIETYILSKPSIVHMIVTVADIPTLLVTASQAFTFLCSSFYITSSLPLQCAVTMDFDYIPMTINVQTMCIVHEMFFHKLRKPPRKTLPR